MTFNFLDLMRDKSTTFPEIDNPEEVFALRIWHCKYRSLSKVSHLINLKELAIATLPDDTLEMLVPLKELRFLSILHMPNVSSIEALSNLDGIESLSLSTSPAWDAAGKSTAIESLEPLIKLKNLQHLELFGVLPQDKSLAILSYCRNLKTARFSKYAQEEVENFYKATMVTNQFNPKPELIS